MQQQTLMRFDPATGEQRPYPSHADQWRDWHGRGMAWLFNPWTGTRRDAGDVGTDVTGQLILPPGEPLYSAKFDRQAAGQSGSLTGGSIGVLMAEQRQSRITPAPHG